METPTQGDEQVRVLSREEGRDLLDRQARRYLGISGEEFTSRYESGEYGDPDDRSRNDPAVMRLAMLLTFVR